MQVLPFLERLIYLVRLHKQLRTQVAHWGQDFRLCRRQQQLAQRLNAIGKMHSH